MPYKIYPIPQNINIKEESFELPKLVKIECDSELSTGTKERLDLALAKREIATSEEAAYSINLEIDERLEDIDAYELSITSQKTSIKAAHEDALFYGVTTFYHIMDQARDELFELEIRDCASYPFRGIIEGYYGHPWGNKKRQDVIDFASYFKANVFAFAPKDDPYHREQWWEMYPVAELEEIGALAQFAKARAVTYFWTISPFMKDENAINQANQTESLERIIAKFEQLYAVGVRGFGVLGDDVGGLEHDTVIYLMNALNQWRKEKGDVKELIFCPEAYCMEDWAFKDGSELNRYDDDFDADIHIIYTGIRVCYPLDKPSIEAYKTTGTENSKRRRDPLYWMNWPVNDIDHEEFRRLFMGPGEVYEPGVAEVTGVLTNPMEQPEASKFAVFATADYAWNATQFEPFSSWEASAQYIDEGASEMLVEIAQHMASQEGRAAYNDARESLKIAELTLQVQASDDKIESIEELKRAYQTIVYSVAMYKVHSKNEDLMKELNPYLSALLEKSWAAIYYINAYLEQDARAKTLADALFAASKKNRVEALSKNQLFANPGAAVINKSLEYLKTLS